MEHRFFEPPKEFPPRLNLGRKIGSSKIGGGGVKNLTEAKSRETTSGSKNRGF